MVGRTAKIIKRRTEKLYYQRNQGKINKEQYRNIQDYSTSLVNTGRIY